MSELEEREPLTADLRLMRYVVAIADAGGFVAAAELLNMAQPPLSQQVAELERTLGVRLFERRPTRLTDAGEVFVAGARRTLAEARRTAAATRDLAVPLRIGYTMSTAHAETPLLLEAMRRDRPLVRVEARQMSDAEIDRGLRGGRIDAAIGRCLPDGPHLRRLTLRAEPWVAVVDAGHRLADRRAFALSELGQDELRVIPRHVSPAYHDSMVAAVAPLGGRIRRTRTPCLRDLDLHGVTDQFTLVPRSVGERLRAGLVPIELSDDLPHVALEVLWRRRAPHPAVRDFVRDAGRIALAHGWSTG